jgi:predicted nucleotidyltransferase
VQVCGPGGKSTLPFYAANHGTCVPENGKATLVHWRKQVQLARRFNLLYNSNMIEDLALPQDLKKAISVASEILLQDGCKEVYIFGSVAKGTYTSDSDIDLATIGLPKERFFASYGRILSRVDRMVDLVALDYDQDFGNRLKAAGTLTRVA